MSVVEKLKENQHAIASMGMRIREEARELGATFSYIDPSDPDHIVVEYPDGRMEAKPLAATSSKIKVRP